MLFFIGSSTKLVAQKQTDYEVQRYSKDSVIVIESERVDTLFIEDAVEENESLPLEERFNRNAIIFKELYGKPE